jgi:quinone-modifying oxidoreductase subunit QmoC
MASAITISPARAFRQELVRRGAAEAARCFQCATCSSVCDLATPEIAFPRRQMLWAQWGLVDRLASDPSIWLCHHCNDCTARCPRDARPGDAMQAIRALVIEQVGAPRFMARLVGRARTNWPILLGVPILFWALLVQAVTGFNLPRTPLVYHDVVPDWLVDAVFVPAAAFAALAAAAGARRVWIAWGEGAARNGTLLQGLGAVALEILGHRRFESCGAARPRRAGHLLLLWGFIGALLTTTAVAAADYVFGMELPLRQVHPVKILGNVSAVLLVVGVVWLIVNRLTRNRETTGTSRAFDSFFLVQVVVVIFTGVGAELGRYALPVPLALAIYVVHLGAILSLFLTFPFSKFAHALYRTLAMAHERLTPRRRPS